MKLLILAGILLTSLLCSTPARAQGQAPTPATPALAPSGTIETSESMTKIDKAIERKDVLMAQEWYRYGEVGDFTINSIILYTPDDTTVEKLYGVAIELKERGLLGDILAGAAAVASKTEFKEGKRSRIYIDFDQLSFLIGALTTVDKFATQIAPREMDYAEVTYITRNHKLGFYQKGRGQTAFALFPGLYKEFSIEDLKNFNKFLQQAMVRLKQMGAK